MAWLIDGPLRRWVQPAAPLVEALGITDEMAVLDFGCGPGYFILELAKRAAWVIAVDMQAEMLQKAKNKVSKAGLANVLLLQSDGLSIQLQDSSIDLALLVTVYHEISDPAAVLAEFHRVLKPSGRLAIVEMVESGGVPFAPIQNPRNLQGEVEASQFQLRSMQPQRRFGIFIFTKRQH